MYLFRECVENMVFFFFFFYNLSLAVDRGWKKCLFCLLNKLRRIYAFENVVSFFLLGIFVLNLAG